MVSEAAMYSALVVESATIFCSLDLHDIGVIPRNVTYPDVDLPVSLSPAKSESVDAESLKSELGSYNIPY